MYVYDLKHGLQAAMELTLRAEVQAFSIQYVEFATSALIEESVQKILEYHSQERRNQR